MCILQLSESLTAPINEPSATETDGRKLVWRQFISQVNVSQPVVRVVCLVNLWQYYHNTVHVADSSKKSNWQILPTFPSACVLRYFPCCQATSTEILPPSALQRIMSTTKLSSSSTLTYPSTINPIINLSITNCCCNHSALTASASTRWAKRLLMAHQKL